MSRKDRRAGTRPLKRKVATRRPRKTLVVFCEGERTEPEYLNALKRQPSVRDVAAVDLRVETRHGDGSVPQDQGSWLDNAQARRLRRQLDGSADKGLDAAKYVPLTVDAARRSAALERRHRQDGAAFPQDNPSSGMHRLIAAVEPPST